MFDLNQCYNRPIAPPHGDESPRGGGALEQVMVSANACTIIETQFLFYK